MLSSASSRHIIEYLIDSQARGYGVLQITSWIQKPTHHLAKSVCISVILHSINTTMKSNKSHAVLAMLKKMYSNPRTHTQQCPLHIKAEELEVHLLKIRRIIGNIFFRWISRTHAFCERLKDARVCWASVDGTIAWSFIYM